MKKINIKSKMINGKYNVIMKDNTDINIEHQNISLLNHHHFITSSLSSLINKQLYNSV